VTFVIRGIGTPLQAPQTASHPKLWGKIQAADSGAATIASCKTLSAEQSNQCNKSMVLGEKEENQIFACNSRNTLVWSSG